MQLLPGSTPGPRARVSITPIKFSQRELMIARIENGANDWLMERHLAARKDGHFMEVIA